MNPRSFFGRIAIAPPARVRVALGIIMPQLGTHEERQNIVSDGAARMTIVQSDTEI
jgi:hypothetical protein